MKLLKLKIQPLFNCRIKSLNSTLKTLLFCASAPLRELKIILLLLTLLPTPTLAQTPSPGLKVVVNSNQDGEIIADEGLTLREAIALVNGTLKIEQLSNAEKAQVTPSRYSRIEFNLPPQKTTIYLQEILPPLNIPRLVIDGTTQPGYDSKKSPTTEINIPQPIVSITPATDAEVFRGLTITADQITIRGLNIYGFTSYHRDTQSTPPADIFIANSFTLPHTIKLKSFVGNISETETNLPPQNVIIEKNWLGMTKDANMPMTTSAFGVSVFNAVGTIIRQNRISYHDGSGIITGIRAEGMQIVENIILGNGLAGIPDAIRLDGIINKSEISSNLICGNDGSGIFLFKPEGSTRIINNQIKSNGRRFRRGAIYLMGNDHQINNNQISDQAGAGIVITSYPQSDRNIIQNNQFLNLEGLSIDLNAFHNVGVQDLQNGDGPNPPRNSPNRRLDTANAAINSPQFLSNEFFSGIGSTVGIDGIAEPDSQVDVYLVSGDDGYGFLHKLVGSSQADAKGKFSLNLSNLQPGDRISAIATLPQYGTSEPAYPALIKSLNNNVSNKDQKVPIANSPPQCLTPPITKIPQPPNPETPTTPIRLKVPKNIHFALDKSDISSVSATVLNKIADVLQKYPFIVIELQGHTDKRASNDYNLALGRRRALATRNYLLNQGVAPERMTIRSFGESQLKIPDDSIVNHALNRRVEVIFKDIRGVNIILENQEEDLQLESSTTNP